MKRGAITSMAAMFFVAIPLTARADFPIVYVREASLSYDFSPSNYDNSPSNYDNSLSNYDNSPSNYDNSPSNYDNLPSNFENAANGDHRLYYRPDKLHMTWAGYYVPNEGYINFFSPSGKRMLYKPKDHVGVFSAEDGSFCGIVAKVDDIFSLALTSHGTEVFGKLNEQ